LLLFHPSSSDKRLWPFWAREEPGGPPGQSRWAVVYRTKQGLDPTAADWSAVRPLPRDASAHDRQPAPLLAAGGDLELFWSSTRAGGWRIFRATLDVGALTWGPAEQITAGPASARGPLAVDAGAGVLLAFRSNQSVAYASATYGATHTLDHRYAGTTTVDTRATDKLALRGSFEDIQTYVYDTGRTNQDRIARDTVGLYLTPDTSDPGEIAATVSRLDGVLSEFMPVTGRAVFITP